MTGGYALLVADLIGVAVFAASGAASGVAKRLDLFGLAFVGFTAALGGGIARDLVIGAVPPLAFTDWRYAVIAVVASVAVFWLHPALHRVRRIVLVLDAAGLGLFTAREIVRRHGGDIELISEKGAGSTFMVKLPHQTSRAGALSLGTAQIGGRRG